MWIYLMAFYTHTPNYGFYCHIETCDRQLFSENVDLMHYPKMITIKKYIQYYSALNSQIWLTLDIKQRTLNIVINLINSIAISGNVIKCEESLKWTSKMLN